MKLFTAVLAVILIVGAVAGMWYVRQPEQTTIPSGTTETATNTATNDDRSSVTYVLPNGWLLDPTTQRFDDFIQLNRPDPVRGILESEALYENQAFIRITTVTQVNEDYEQLRTLLTSGSILIKTATATDPYESKLLAEDGIELDTLRGRVYTHTNALSGELLDTRVTGVMQQTNGTLIYVKAGYGNGADAEQLLKDIFAIIRSLYRRN